MERKIQLRTQGKPTMAHINHFCKIGQQRSVRLGSEISIQALTAVILIAHCTLHLVIMLLIEHIFC